jgi:GAF domain-containing protein
MTEIKRSGSYDAEFAHVMAEAVRTLASDFEFLDLAHQLTVSTASLLGAGAAGVMLEDATGRLQVLSASDEDTRLLEIFELQREEGPCYECWRSGTVVTAPDILTGDRWPSFVKEARTLGFVSAAAVPLRLRARVVGALNVFWTTPWTVSAQDMDAVQALADVAAVGLVQQRLARESGVVAEQLGNALHSRVTIEQAKGLVATKAHVDIDDAFGILEAYAVASGSSVVAVAQDVVDRIITWQDGALRPA